MIFYLKKNKQIRANEILNNERIYRTVYNIIRLTELHALLPKKKQFYRIVKEIRRN